MSNRYDFEPTVGYYDVYLQVFDDKDIHIHVPRNKPTDSYYIHKEDLLKTACKAYIHDKREGLTEREAMIAHLAGYDVADSEGDFWGHDDDYSDTGLNLHYTPHKIIEPKPATIEIPISRLQALEAEIKELKAQKGCE